MQITHQLSDLFSPDSDVVCDKGMSEPCLRKVLKQVILVITCCHILCRNVRDLLGEGSFLHLDGKQFLPFLFVEVGHSSCLGISKYWRPQVFSACAGFSDLIINGLMITILPVINTSFQVTRDTFIAPDKVKLQHPGNKERNERALGFYDSDSFLFLECSL